MALVETDRVDCGHRGIMANASRAVVIAVALLLAEGRALAGGSDAGDAAAWTCPSVLPYVGDPCPTPQLSCEFGGDSFGRCARLMQCSALGKWALVAPGDNCHTNPPECPGAPNDLDAGSACPLLAPNDLCVYASETCGCTPCATSVSSSSTQWSCEPRSVDSGCPSQRPLIGSACSTQGQSCPWSDCCYGLSIGPDEHCDDGLWQYSVGGNCVCPPLPACAVVPVFDGSPLDPPVDTDAETPDSSFSDFTEDVGANPACRCTTNPSSSTAAPGALALALLGAWLVRRRR